MARRPPGFRPSRVQATFSIVARDYDRALALARLSGTQAFLMQQAREESWVKSMPKRKGDAMHGTATPFTFDVRRLAGILKADESVVYRNVKSLVSMHLLARVKDGRLSIQKDYHDWTQPDGETPLFDDGDLGFIRAAVAIGRRSKEADTHKSDNKVLLTKKSETHTNGACTFTDEKVSAYDDLVIKSDFFVSPPIEERADLETNSDTTTTTMRDAIGDAHTRTATALTDAEIAGHLKTLRSGRGPRTIAAAILDSAGLLPAEFAALVPAPDVPPPPKPAATPPAPEAPLDVIRRLVGWTPGDDLPRKLAAKLKDRRWTKRYRRALDLAEKDQALMGEVASALGESLRDNNPRQSFGYALADLIPSKNGA